MKKTSKKPIIIKKITKQKSLGGKKMTEEQYKYRGDNEETKSILKKLIEDNPTNKWEEDNVITFSKDKKEIGRITLNGDDDGVEIIINGEEINKQYKVLKKIIDEANKPLPLSEYENTPLEKELADKKELGGLSKNRKVLHLINDSLTSLNIKKVLVERNINMNETIQDEVQLLINCNPNDDSKDIEDDGGYYSRLKTFLFDTYELSYTKKDEIQINNYRMFNPLSKEKIEDIKIGEMLIGKYYKERNMIMLFFNPFNMNDIGVFDEELSILWVEILEILKEMKVNKENNFEIREKIFISSFMKKSRDRLKTIENEIRNHLNNITDYERSIASMFMDLNSKEQEKVYIETMLDSKGSGLFAEIERIKELPFVKDMKINAGTVEITFKPTVVPIANFKRDMDKGFGKRYAYVGSITILVSPDGFKVKGDAPMINGRHPHPHGSSPNSDDWSGPCMGDGEGKAKIYNLLAGNKFYDLSKMLWFWVKTYREEGAYVKGRPWYDDRLQQGFPVFDDKGNRIEINEPERLKTGEQVKLTKAPSYDENIKRFKDFKME